MSKQSLLLVDGDTRSLRVLEVSLRKAGFSVTPAASVQDALDKLELHAPDLIISETTFPSGDGFDLRRRVRGTPEWGEIPFIFLTAEAAIENKIRGLELGVDDYLTKPIYIKEIVTRINILLQKRQRTRFEERKDGRTRFAGRVADMPVVDVIQTIEISRKSGVIQFVGERGRQAAIYFRDGKVIDAEAGTLQGEDAVYRLLTWSEGEFEVVFRTVRRREVITTSSQGLLMEGMRRLDEWSRLLEQLPPLTHRFEIDTLELAARLGDVPDDNNKILRLIDGKRTLLEVIDASDFGDLECLQAVSRLFFEELLLDLDQGKPARADTGKPIPLVEVEGDAPMPIEEVGSGPQRDAEVVSEEPAPGSLLGGYRPSSLRLIDEAVAAAQAIEPSLFDDDPPAPARVPVPASASAPAPAPAAAPAPVTILPSSAADFAAEEGTAAGVEAVPELEADDDSVPHEIPADDPSPPRRAPPRKRPTAPPPIPVRPLERDESGMRMIGSLGRERAEVSGELALGALPTVPVSENQRELVTILPRRITREVPIVVAPVPEPAAKGAATPPPTPARPPTPAPPVDPPIRRPPPPRLSTQGSGVVRASSRPSASVLVFFGLAVLLAGITFVLWLKRPSSSTPHVAMSSDASVDAPQLATLPPDDAGVGVGAIDSIAPVAVDASIAPADAPLPPPVDASISPRAQAKTLVDQAANAIQEGEFDQALSLANASLKLHRTVRTYLVRAQAQQRLGRVDDALDSVELAEELSPSSPSVWEARGAILWSARRWDDAHDAYNKFLELEQEGSRADRIRRRLAEPH